MSFFIQKIKLIQELKGDIKMEKIFLGGRNGPIPEHTKVHTVKSKELLKALAGPDVVTGTDNSGVVLVHAERGGRQYLMLAHETDPMALKATFERIIFEREGPGGEGRLMGVWFVSNRESGVNFAFLATESDIRISDKDASRTFLKILEHHKKKGSS